MFEKKILAQKKQKFIVLSYSIKGHTVNNREGGKLLQGQPVGKQIHYEPQSHQDTHKVGMLMLHLNALEL